MALRDQPYLPLYVQDFLTDERLRECSAESVGVYIMVMCLMHKSSEYGTILLRQKDKQKEDMYTNFALKLIKHLPYEEAVIVKSLKELVCEGVLNIEGDLLSQLRMVEDNRISLLRSKAGEKGYFAKAKVSAKGEANTENETVIENEVKSTITTSTEKQNFNIIDIYLKDLPNSQLLEDACRNTGTSKELFLAYVPEFKKRLKAKYKDFYDFVDHFKFSYLKKKEFETPKQITAVAPASFKPFKKP